MRSRTRPEPTEGPLAPATVSRLREALEGAGYTYAGVEAALGPQAHGALVRHETTPALRRTTGGSPVETLVRLFALQRPVSAGDAERALPGLVGDLVAAGILATAGGEVRARLDVAPYAVDDADLWLVSDLTPGLDGAAPVTAADHVLGVTHSATSLAQLTLREPVDRALDLGTGCGVQALHLAAHARTVVATDVNRRALRLARLNAELNGVAGVEVREGSLFEPVADETFDLVAVNPPFVISPGTEPPLAYRDSGLPGDQVVERIVRAAPGHLREGGWCQLVADWAIGRDRPWEERVAGWLDGSCDALVVRREVLDVAAYAEMWLRDAGRTGADYVAAYDAWLAWFERTGIEAVGFGWINLRRTGRGARAARTFLDWPYAVEQPVAPAVGAWGRALDAEVTADSRLVVADGVRQETSGAPGAEDPETILLRQRHGLRRARRVDTVEAALVGACDGELTLGRILDAVARLLGRDEAGLREAYLPVVRELLVEGYLVSPGPPAGDPARGSP